MKPNNIMGFLYACAKPFRLLVCGQLVVTLLWAVDVSLRPYILKIMLDDIQTAEPSQAFETLVPPACYYLGLSLIIFLAFRLYDFIWLHLNPRLKRQVGTNLINLMMDQSQNAYQNQFAGNSATKVKDVMSSVPDVFEIGINQFLSHFIAILIAAFTLWQTNAKFALALIGWLVIFLWGTFLFSKTAKKLAHYAAEVRSRVVGHMVDLLSNIMNVRVFSGKKVEMDQFSLVLHAYLVADQKRDWFFLKMFTFQGLSFLIYQGICLWFLITGFQNETVTAGDFALVLTLNLHIIDFLWTLARDIGDFAKALGDVSQGLSIAQAPIDIKDKPDAKPLRVDKGEIRFEHVDFNFPKTTHLFTDLNVVIKPGQKVGLVGYSGSGKTSFVNLLLRLWDIDKGRILIDGQDIRDVTLDSLRKAVSLIPQEPLLFHRTLMENIRYGRMDATDQEVVEAAEKAFAHEFIIQSPEGYNAMVGERAVKLSGGQKQRIAIARAILKNAPILILDEATSQLDSITEQKIQQSLFHLMENKTALVIAHRLSTILQMERILVFDKGKIVQDGTHADLLAQEGLYKDLWEAQTGDFLPDYEDEEPEEKEELPK